MDQIALENSGPNSVRKDDDWQCAEVDYVSQDTLHSSGFVKSETVQCDTAHSCAEQGAARAEFCSNGKNLDCFTEQVAKGSFEAGSNLKTGCNREASQEAAANCVAIVNSYKDEVVDVSPTGYTLSALASLSTQESEITQIQKMYVFDNIFTILPASLSRFKNLKSLKLFANEVKILPDEVGDLVHLETLQIKVHPTGLGSLPPLGNLNSLKVLELHQAPLRPSVVSLPRDISRLHTLKRLAVCNFSISFLPPEIGCLKNLEELDLSFNRLKNLPKEVSSLEALRHLRAGNNRLTELPSELTSLPNLISIDVSHNRLTSLDSLLLSGMTSLRALDAKFNKLRSIGNFPDWISCNVEGNHLGVIDQVASSSEDDAVDSELLPFSEYSAAKQDKNVSFPLSISSSPKEKFLQKNTRHVKSRRRWKRHNNQQQKARQDRLNISRKSRVEGSKDREVHVERIMVRTALCPEETNAEHEPVFHENKEGNDGEKSVLSYSGIDVSCDVSGRHDSSSRQERVSVDNAEVSCGIRRSMQKSACKHDVPCLFDDHLDAPADCGKYIDSHSSRKVISGDRCKQHLEKGSFVKEDGDVSNLQKYNLNSEEEQKHGTQTGRRKSSSLDKNPKPTKRRKSVQNFSDVSHVYYSQSLCGFGDRLQDGFYDAGRECSFSALDVLESEQPRLDNREVILVDREQDEELDVIVLSAQQFIAALELAGLAVGKGESCRLNAFQKAAILALFVSDCYGGSDKTLNVANTRRAALGGTAGVPFVCSCSSVGNSSAVSRFSESSGFPGVIPSLHMLCEGAIRIRKMQRGSNVLPIGSLPYGVCRHRAILFKYLCDRVSIPCELVRGYLDYMPHAWNVILANKGGVDVRMLVDACRPLDIREERDPEYFCRYIPFRRVHLPPQVSRDAGTSESAALYQLLDEEIGHGASGSVVRQCRLGSVVAAAKVRFVDQAAEATYPDIENMCLSELRIFCSLGEHPCIVSFYGHHFSPVRVASNTEGRTRAPLVIFMEYIKGGSLESVLNKWREQGRTYMPAKQALYVARDVAHALSFLHFKHILHRDIKSSNVLVDLEAKKQDDIPLVKLCDFDRAVPLSSSSLHSCYLAHRGVPAAEVCVGTPRWMAPEVLRAMYERHSYGLEADIWSYGCLLFELLTLRVPYSGFSDSEIHSHIQRGQRPHLPADLERVTQQMMHVSEDSSRVDFSNEDVDIFKLLVRLFNSCTESCPSNRPTALEVYTNLSAFTSNKFSVGLMVPFENVAASVTEMPSSVPNMEFLEDPSSGDGITPDRLQTL